ncbi:MAG: hypothetical protein FJ145_22445 [Deltaproteobacteria bacterium]|nr:hypothetical protein [Deltaproteobacteria bacterium]
MFAQIKHAAIYTPNPANTIPFYEKILGMKKITTGAAQNVCGVAGYGDDPQDLRNSERDLAG